MSDLERQLTLTSELVEQRIELGDRAESPRRVDHTATFHKKRDAAAAAAELADLGYDVNVRRALFRTTVLFSAIAAVDG